MTKQEFMDQLSEKLYEALPTAAVLSQVQYYQGYIDGEVTRGKTEEQVIEELGDPILIARSIIESPHEDDSQFMTSQEDAYYEGNYQASHQKTAEDVMEQMRKSQEAIDRQYREAKERASNAAYKDAASENNAGDAFSFFEEDPDVAEHVTGTTETGKRSLFKDQNGEINWAALAAIMAVIMVVVSIIWIVTRIVSLLGPVILLVLAAMLVYYVVNSIRS